MAKEGEALPVLQQHLAVALQDGKVILVEVEKLQKLLI